MSKKITKADAEIIFQIHAEYICKRFGFGDEEEPTIQIASMRDAYGEYERRHHRYDPVHTEEGYLTHKHRVVKHLITIIPSARFDNETLIHELAHYVQKMIEGTTCCWEMKRAGMRPNAMDDLCERHADYMNTIRDMIDRKI